MVPCQQCHLARWRHTATGRWLRELVPAVPIQRTLSTRRTFLFRCSAQATLGNSLSPGEPVRWCQTILLEQATRPWQTAKRFEAKCLPCVLGLSWCFSGWFAILSACFSWWWLLLSSAQLGPGHLRFGGSCSARRVWLSRRFYVRG